MKKEQNGRESLRKLNPIVGCNASKRRRRRADVRPIIFRGLGSSGVLGRVGLVTAQHRRHAATSSLPAATKD